MTIHERLIFDTVPGEKLERLFIGEESFYYGLSQARGKCFGTVLLLHGVASNGSRWEEFTEKTILRRHWNIVRLDLRGHGGNDSLVCGTLEQFADDGATVLQSIEPVFLHPCIVIGHSLGAQIALQMAVRHPKLVDGIILLDPLVTEALTEKARSKAKWVPLLRVTETLARAGNWLGLRRKLKKYSLRQDDCRAREMLAQGGEALQQFIRDYSSPTNDISHVHTATYMRDLLEVSRPSPESALIRCPTLVIGSSAGVFTDPDRMEKWTNGLRDGEQVLVECAHWPLTECLREVSQVIEVWIERKFSQLSKK